MKQRAPEKIDINIAANGALEMRWYSFGVGRASGQVFVAPTILFYMTRWLLCTNAKRTRRANECSRRVLESTAVLFRRAVHWLTYFWRQMRLTKEKSSKSLRINSWRPPNNMKTDFYHNDPLAPRFILQLHAFMVPFEFPPPQFHSLNELKIILFFSPKKSLKRNFTRADFHGLIQLKLPLPRTNNDAETTE